MRRSRLSPGSNNKASISLTGMADEMITDGTADLVFLARALLKDPYWARFAAETLGATNALDIPIQYRRAVARMTMKTQW